MMTTTKSTMKYTKCGSHLGKGCGGTNSGNLTIPSIYIFTKSPSKKSSGIRLECILEFAKSAKVLETKGHRNILLWICRGSNVQRHEILMEDVESHKLGYCS